MSKFTRCFFLIFVFGITILISTSKTSAQSTTVHGIVTDRITGEPIPFVNVIVIGKSFGAVTDFDGQFTIQSVDPFNKIKISLLGYKDELRDVDEHRSQNMYVQLQKTAKELKEVTVKAGKRKYSNKNNPAVDLIREVIAHKKENRKEDLDAFECERYEKVQFAVSNLSEKFKNRKYIKKFQFIFDNIDTTKLAGKEILPIYLRETLSDYYYRKSPLGKKEIVKGTQKVNFEKFFDNDGISTFMNYLYQDVDIYKNNFEILTNRFISPVADAAPLYYRYYILDTLKIDSMKCIKLGFFPRNKEDFLLQGNLYILLDSTYAIRRDEMQVSTEINLNFVRELMINQDFSEVEKHEWMISKDELSIDFGIAKSRMGMFGQRSVSSRNYKLNQPKADPFYDGETVIVPDSAERHDSAYWLKARHEQLTKSEQGVYNSIDSLQKVPAFRHAMSVFVLLFAGYKDFGPIEIGPVNTFYSYNPIEGVRVRFGGRTTPTFSKRFNVETYGAYGTLDDRWKYYVGATYSLGGKSYREWPLNDLKFSYQEETRIPGQELQFVQEDNALLSVKRGDNNKMLYNHIFNADYLHEFHNHLSYGLGIQYLKQEPAGTLYFNPKDYYQEVTYRIPSITTGETYLDLRYAPNEQFYQGKNYRTPMANKYPIIEARYTRGWKNFLYGEYNYDRVNLSFYKRFFLPPIGYTDVIVEGGRVFGTVPYPLLDIHRANQTYSYQLQSYNLMNFLEFVSDRFVSLNVDHFFNGFFFNKIPLFMRLKWREVATVKVLYGAIGKNNRPENNVDLFKFPVLQNGVPLTYSLEKKPYIEASVGIANIFKLFRVDLIRRFSYLDHPTVSQFGVRARFKFDF